MDCFGTYFTHVQTCDVTLVQSATEWTASVHTLHMSKPLKEYREACSKGTCAVSPSNACHPDALDWLDSELQEEKSS